MLSFYCVVVVAIRIASRVNKRSLNPILIGTKSVHVKFAPLTSSPWSARLLSSLPSPSPSSLYKQGQKGGEIAERLSRMGR